MKATTMTIVLLLSAAALWAQNNPQQSVINSIDAQTPCGHQRHVAEAAVEQRKAGALETDAVASAVTAAITTPRAITDAAIVRAAYAIAPATLSDPDAAHNFSVSVLRNCMLQEKK